MISLNHLGALAHERLPSRVADAFCSRLKPQGRMLSAATGPDGHGPDRPRGGALGGEPALPEAAEWPVWEGHGPLSFVASLDCAALAATGEGPVSGLPLPTSGTLLFFYFDGRAANYAQLVDPTEPTTPGARVLHVPAGTPTAPRPTPESLEPYRHVPLCVEPAVEFHVPEVERFYASLGLDAETVATDPVYVGFRDAVEELVHSRACHQVGGAPQELGGWGPEYTVADFPPHWDLEEFTPDNPHLGDIQAEAARWRLLLQLDSDEDAEMEWGDAGILYWLMTDDDLAAHRFDHARFTWQSH
ncbi:DUF1963 domain-containing protein [Streptomyces sedi]|uniref:DUF1963 domain-containing protein n=1 Tax=Streptomyces sedi TaxID=555059 RepID=A0A5C4USY0_9ACTN|nr:YwqG family protein [Streptomyces sedi]TNM26029.1 DUF1963 domain-containing protein [Streptomyces sedi]